MEFNGNHSESGEYERHLSNLTRHTENKFKTLRNNSQRVDFILDLFRGKMDLDYVKDAKSDQKALDFMSRSKESYRNRCYLSSLKSITQSVAQCGENDRILSEAYAFRALVLSEINLLKESEEDAKRALNLGYRAESLNLNAEIIEKAVDLEKYHEELPKVDDNCIEIKFTEEFGHHVVASRNIEIGEIVLIENPIACVLKTNDFIHCSHCLELCYNLIPCANCTEALYCGAECKNESFRRFHKYECAIIKFFEIEQDRSLYVPIRITLMMLTGAFTNFQLQDIRKLATNFPKRPLKEIMSFAELSAEIFSLIKIHTDFFKENLHRFANDGREIEREFKETIMTQLMVFTINSVETPEILIPMGENYSKIVGCGLYPTFSNFNHSCNPKIFRYFHGASIILRSIATIAKGEQCFITYGPRFDYKPKIRRQRILRQHYHFNCVCEACVQDWPLIINEVKMQFPNCTKDLEYIELKEKVKSGNRQSAKAILSKLIQELKNSEKSENLLTLTYLQFILREYYALLGNRRQIIR